MPFLDHSLYLKKSTIPGAGKGLFTKKDIAKGTRITEYKGKLHRWVDIRDEDGHNPYIFKIHSRLAVDGKPAIHTFGRYANDALGFVRVKGIRNNSEYEVEGRRVYIDATRNIKKGEEILVEYGAAFWRLVRKVQRESQPVAKKTGRKNKSQK